MLSRRQQLKQLQRALINAFPSKSFLEQLLYYELEKNLNEITKDSDLQDIVFKLIQTAESQGWLEELIRAARKENPRNLLLQPIAQELLTEETPQTPSHNIPQELELLNRNNELNLNSQPEVSTPTAKSSDNESHCDHTRNYIETKSIQTSQTNDLSSDRNVTIDVFLCHNSNDKPLVIKIAEALEKRGLKPWIPKNNINSEAEFQSAIQAAISQTKSAVIFFGLNEVEKQQHEEINALNKEKVNRNIRLISVRLPTNVKQIPPEYDFLKERNCLELDKTVDWLQNDEKSKLFLDTFVDDLLSELELNKKKYYEYLISQYKNYQTEGLVPLSSLFLSHVFVTLKVDANYTDNARSEMIPLKNYERNTQKRIWDFLIAATGNEPTLNQPSIVVLGAPGSGKTTLLKHLAYVYAKEKEKEQDEKAPELIPVLLLIRDIYKKIVEKEPTLENIIAEEVKIEREENQTSQSLSKWLSEKLKANECLIMLDGLDEVADETQRLAVRNWVDQQINSFSKNVFILTSRPRGYKEASLKNVGIVLEVQPFKIEQVRDFIDKWYLATEKIRLLGDSFSEIEEQAKQQAEDLINRIRNSSPLAAMAVNPLLLTMISMVHHKLSLEKKSLPEKRVELYKEMCEVLLEKRQKEKNINDELIEENKQSVLQVLALKLMQQEESEFRLVDGASWIQKQLVTTKPEKFFEQICYINGLLVEKELKYYQFAHLSFQEYLAATEIRKLNQEDLLISKIDKFWWAETIRLFAAQSNATTLICAVLNMPSPSADLMALAYDCLEESLKVDENVRKELIQRLDDGLESTDSEIFKLAVQVRLIRRFRNFVRIDEEFEIDNICITCAEYQLFLDETGKSRQPQHWQSKRFLCGNAKKPITGISWENALRFCAWLGEWYRTRLGNQLSEFVVHYKLSTDNQRKQHFIKDEQQFSEGVIHLVKFQLPSRYSKLADHLWSGEWKKADDETGTVMSQVALKQSPSDLNKSDIQNFPCDDLCIIDKLWQYASKKHFGFSVQKNIYESLGGGERLDRRIWDEFGEQVGWRVDQAWMMSHSILTYDTTAPLGHLPVMTTGHFNILSSVASRLTECSSCKFKI